MVCIFQIKFYLLGKVSTYTGLRYQIVTLGQRPKLTIYLGIAVFFDILSLFHENTLFNLNRSFMKKKNIGKNLENIQTIYL